MDQMAEHCTGIPNVIGSIPTVVGHILKLTRCGYRLVVKNVQVLFATRAVALYCLSVATRTRML